MSIPEERIDNIISEDLDYHFPSLLEDFGEDIFDDIVEHLIFLTTEGDRSNRTPTKEEMLIGIFEHLSKTGTFITSKDLETMNNNRRK